MQKATRRAGIVLLVIATFVLLALSASITHVGGTAQHVRQILLNTDISTIKMSLARYRSITGRYPTTEQGLATLVTQPTEPYIGRGTLLSSMPKDPWGSDYIYFCPGRVHPESYDLYSAGPDRIPGTSDDDWGR
jgi:general secretion pathway protein G